MRTPLRCLTLGHDLVKTGIGNVVVTDCDRCGKELCTHDSWDETCERCKGA